MTLLRAAVLAATALQGAASHSQKSIPRVKVQAYTEALCIDCFHFFKNDLLPTYQALGDEVIELELVPFGNAQIVDDQSHTIRCQHGVAECDANSWEQCALYLVSGHSKDDSSPIAATISVTELYLNFFDCLESALPMGHYEDPFETKVFLDCAAQSTTSDGATIDGQRLRACHDNPLMSWTLQVQAAHETPDDHTFVPWVLVNGKFLDPDKERLQHRICQEYERQGGSHPNCVQ